MRMLKYILFFVFFVFLSCALLKSARKVFAIKNLDISLSRVEIQSVDLGGIRTMLYIEAQNPNEVEAEIVSFDFDVLVNSEKIARGRVDRNITVPPHGKKEIEIPLYLPFSGMSRGVKRVLINKSAEVGIKGYAVINTTLGILRFRVVDRTDRIF